MTPKPRIEFLLGSFVFMLLYVLFTASVLQEKQSGNKATVPLILKQSSNIITRDLHPKDAEQPNIQLNGSRENRTQTGNTSAEKVSSKTNEKRLPSGEDDEGTSGKQVLLYTYMRGGSSFVGEMLRLHPQAMYWFEPIDSFYQGLFGMLPSTTPLNILYYRNHTKRNITRQETQAMIEFIRKLFGCRYTDTPMTVFGDHHIRRSGIFFSLNALTIASVKRCLNHLLNICHAQNTTPHDTSHKNIQHAVDNKCLENIQRVMGHKPDSFNAILTNSTDRNFHQRFVDYNSCMQEVNKTFQKCCHANALSQCQKKPIQALKTIRLPMDMVEDILLEMPSMKIVYYVRDPRAIMFSRNSSTPLLTFDPITEAQLLCKRMASDLKIFSTLQQKYPNRTLRVSYEEFAEKPYEMLKQFYTFLKVHIAKDVWVGLKRAIGIENKSINFHKNVGNKFSAIRHNASSTAQSWRRGMNTDYKQAVTDTCSQVLSQLNYQL